MYTAVLLRVRGNLAVVDGKWQLRFVPRGERWQLAISRDVTDSYMMQVAAWMVWYVIRPQNSCEFTNFICPSQAPGVFLANTSNNSLILMSTCQVAYSVMLLPVTIARFIAFGGGKVPFWATILADFIFNLQGSLCLLN